MNPLNNESIQHIFTKLDSLESLKDLVVPSTLKPANHNKLNLEWRYQLLGYLEGLRTARLINDIELQELINLVKGSSYQPTRNRPGKEFPYSIDIITDNQAKFDFDVPAMNDIDAYFQLTKRIAYKSIPGIEKVDVYSGYRQERAIDALPLRTLNKDELIFVSLL